MSKINDLKNLKNKTETPNSNNKAENAQKETPKPNPKKEGTPKPEEKNSDGKDGKKENKSTPKVEAKKDDPKENKDGKKENIKDATPKLEAKKEETKKEEETKKDKKGIDNVGNPQKRTENDSEDKDKNKMNISSDNLDDKSILSIKKNDKGQDSLLNLSKSDEEDKYGHNKSKLDNSSILKKNYSRIEIDADKQFEDVENNKKIFMTEHHLKFDNKELFTFHDLIVPAGKNAKLCIVNEPYNKAIRLTEIADHFKFIEPTGVILLIGANTKNKGKLFAGISRAAYNTKAIIIDSGLQTGIEKFCIRRSIPLVGIAPENKIEYPKPNPEKFSNKMLTNGHTHFILLGNDMNKFNWGDEAKFKIQFADRIINGRKGFPYKGKGVGIILGNIPNCIDEILYCVERKWPLILIEDSDLTAAVAETREGGKSIGDGNIKKIAEYSKLIEIEDDSENLASAVHLCLTISF